MKLVLSVNYNQTFILILKIGLKNKNNQLYPENNQWKKDWEENYRLKKCVMNFIKGYYKIIKLNNFFVLCKQKIMVSTNQCFIK